jgi:hypothetical protein
MLDQRFLFVGLVGNRALRFPQRFFESFEVERIVA